MFYCKWDESFINGLNSEGFFLFYAEIDSNGFVRREIGLNKEGKVIHKCPSEFYPNGTYGYFDNQKVIIIDKTSVGDFDLNAILTDENSLVTKEEFEKIWEMDKQN